MVVVGGGIVEVALEISFLFFPAMIKRENYLKIKKGNEILINFYSKNSNLSFQVINQVKIQNGLVEHMVINSWV